MNYEYEGICLTHQKIVPGNTITSIDSKIYTYARWKLEFDAGTDEIVAGDWIVGATSGAVAKVVSISDLTSGSWAADNAVGYLIIDSYYGTFQDNEKLKVAADATMADVKGTVIPWFDGFPYIGKQAKCAHVICLAQTALIGIAGGKPDQTALVGTPLIAGAELWIHDINDIMNFKCVDYTAASASTINIDFYF